MTHMLTSAAIGAHVESVPFAFSLALLFHFFADTLLHWNIYTERHRWPYVWVAADVIAALVLTYWLVPETFFTAPMLAAMIGGNLPDIWCGILDVLIRLLPRRAQTFHRLFIPFHEKLQNETLNPAKGLAWQVVLVIFVVLFFSA